MISNDRTGSWDAVAIDAADNVAVALTELSSTAKVHVDGISIELALAGTIPIGHKFALRSIPKGAPVLKYGQAIGTASVDIPAGSHVHVQNVSSSRAQSVRPLPIDG